MSTILKPTLAGLLFAAVFLISFSGASAEAQQRVARLCDGSMVVQTIEPFAAIGGNEGPSVEVGLVEWQGAADPSYCADCSCDDEDCNENCSKCW